MFKNRWKAGEGLTAISHCFVMWRLICVTKSTYSSGSNTQLYSWKFYVLNHTPSIKLLRNEN